MANIEEQGELMEEIRKQHEQQPHPGLAGPRLRLHLAIHAVVETQLREGTPPETAVTLARLQAEGLDEHEARHAIGTVVADEMSAIMGTKEPYSEARYVTALRALTAASFRRMLSGDDEAED